MALLLALLPAPRGSAWQVSTGCTATGAETLTPALQAPDGAVYRLGTRTEDDHGKNTHLCQSTFFLRWTGLAPEHKGGEAEEVGIGDDGAWSRAIQLALLGFSADGRWVLGLTCETGAGKGHRPQVLLVGVEPGTGESATVDLESLVRRDERGCPDDLAVEGVGESGQVFLSRGGGRTMWAGELRREELTSLHRAPAHGRYGSVRALVRGGPGSPGDNR